MPRVNGTLPDSYGLSLSVYVSTASEANPIEQGDVLSWSATGNYTAVPAADGAEVDLVAKHPVSDPLTPLGVYVYGFSRVERLTYSGTAPGLGTSVVANGTGGVRAATAGVDNGSRVVYVDTTRSYVEVLLP
ncbi:hypothetical protein [Fictibacillus sp. NRS-1165]|uniref:hypothetical protein n=1 Tax=Fictibacillus sp. NRS-1165 TaxID=3144463 RepID=UPI003D1ADEB2